jgi:hypothetical protein
MDFADRLRGALEGGDEATSALIALTTWNDEIEAFLSAPPAPQTGKPNEEAKNECSKETLTKVSAKLHYGVLGSIHPMIGEVDEEISEERGEELSRSALNHFQQSPDDANKEKLEAHVRATKNLLRWYIQIFLEKEGRLSTPITQRLQSDAMLELFVRLLEQNCGDTDDRYHQELARNCSLFLFYATYGSFPGDETAQKSLNHLVMNLGFPEIALRRLLKPCTTALALSLVRNIHSLLVSLKGGMKIVAATSLDWDASMDGGAAPWAPKDAGKVTFLSVFGEIIGWSFSSNPPFPGPEDDKRGELLAEILGCFYALRIGKDLHLISECSNRVLDILRFPNNKEKRAYQCKLSTVSLMMDSDPALSQYFVDNGTVSSLLEILDIQVTEVVEDTRVDDSAAAALVPILTLLNKFCIANSAFRKQVKDFIFPPEAEEEFQRKAQERRTSAGTTKNMSPLDAPNGTLRWKMTRLMTWTESYVKRCTSELMWTICSSDAQEFTLRTGLGNAIPMLSLKGFMQMPSQTSTSSS